MASVYSDVVMAPPIEVFALNKRCNEDSFQKKVNLGVGAYRTDDGKPWVLPVVRTAEAQMANDVSLNHEYLPVAGMPDFVSGSVRMLLSEENPAITQNRVEGIQCLGGTGAIRLAAEFLKRILGYNTVFISKPTWENHKGIFQAVGFTDVREYTYWEAATRSLNLKGMLDDLRTAPERSVVILHACAHNPTGIDPTETQWEQIADVCEEKKIFVLMDSAYQGFASGDLDKDAYAVRYFVKRGFEFIVAQSFSKNFGLYNERIGTMVVVANTPEVTAKIKSQCELIVRKIWSNPPNHGARIVATVLNNPAYYEEWRDQVRTMADRIQQMRQEMFKRLRAKGTPGNWEHIIKQIGMFSFTGLNFKQVDHLINQHHIYLLKEGRINMCGLNSKNIDYVVDAIDDAVRTVTDPVDSHL